VTAEQMEISRLRAELARVRMKRDNLGKATARLIPSALFQLSRLRFRGRSRKRPFLNRKIPPKSPF